jgi:hypothetical protein
MESGPRSLTSVSLSPIAILASSSIGSLDRRAIVATKTEIRTAQITCINKSDRYNPHEAITHVGGQGFWHTQATAILLIEAGQRSFWVHVGGKSVWVIVAKSRWGNKYLKTQDDGEDENNLLSLPECC